MIVIRVDTVIVERIFGTIRDKSLHELPMRYAHCCADWVVNPQFYIHVAVKQSSYRQDLITRRMNQ